MSATETLDAQNRFRDVIAERRLVATFADGTLAPVVLRVSRPYVHPRYDHACTVQAEGLQLWQGPSDIFGVDAWQALMLGIRFLQLMLTKEMERGAVFHWEDGEEAVSIEELFSRGQPDD